MIADVPILHFIKSTGMRFVAQIDDQWLCDLELVGGNRWRWTIRTDSASDSLGQGVVEGPWQSAAAEAQSYLNAAYPMR